MWARQKKPRLTQVCGERQCVGAAAWRRGSCTWACQKKPRLTQVWGQDWVWERCQPVGVECGVCSVEAGLMYVGSQDAKTDAGVCVWMCVGQGRL